MLPLPAEAAHGRDDVGRPQDRRRPRDHSPFGATFSAELPNGHTAVDHKRHLDEMVIAIDGENRWLRPLPIRMALRRMFLSSAAARNAPRHA